MKKLLSILLVAILLVPCALAETGVLSFGADSFSGSAENYDAHLPQAVIQTIDCAREYEGIRFEVKEAATDGRIIKIYYTVTDLSGAESVNDTQDDYYALCAKTGVSLKCDGNGEILINGRGVNLRNVLIKKGDQPGVYEFHIDTMLETYPQNGEKVYPRIALDGRNEIVMQLTVKSPSGDRTDELRFPLSCEEKYLAPLPGGVSLQGGTLAFQTLALTPLGVFVDYTVSVPGPFSADDDEALWDAADALSFPAELRDRDGKALCALKDGSFQTMTDENGAGIVVYHCEFTPCDMEIRQLYMNIGETQVTLVEY